MENIMKKLNKNAAKITKSIETMENSKFIIAYAYFIKNYYELKSEYSVYKKSGKINKKKINEKINEINHVGKLLDDSFKIGKFENNNFYKLHKSIMQKWNNNTPRDKIIKTLELWTGEYGEDAVIKTIHKLQNNSQDIFSHMLNLHGFINLTNSKIRSGYYNCLYTLFKYYIIHRDKYFDVVSTKKIKMNNDNITLQLSDDFNNLNIKFKGNNFSNFNKTVEEIINGITKLDQKILIKLINSGIQPGSADNIYYRREIKNNILKIANNINDEIKFHEDEIDINIVKPPENVKGLIKLVNNFIKAEKEVEKNIEIVKENIEIQSNNIKLLTENIYILCGPDTKPCIRNIAPEIYMHLQKDPKNFNTKGKLTTQGEKNIINFI